MTTPPRTRIAHGTLPPIAGEAVEPIAREVVARIAREGIARDVVGPMALDVVAPIAAPAEPSAVAENDISPALRMTSRPPRVTTTTPGVLMRRMPR